MSDGERRVPHHEIVTHGWLTSRGAVFRVASESRWHPSGVRESGQKPELTRSGRGARDGTHATGPEGLARLSSRTRPSPKTCRRSAAPRRTDNSDLADRVARPKGRL